MKNQIKFVIIFYIALALLTQSVQINAQNEGELFLPERIELEADLQSQAGNDIYFFPPIESSLLTHDYLSEESSYNVYATDGMARSAPLGRNPFDTFSASNPSFLYHASNKSNNDLSLTFSTIYYDLTGGGDNLNGLENLVLFEDERSGVRFEATTGEPLILDLKMKGQSAVLTVDIFLVSPTGIVWDYSTVYVNKFQTFINEFIPIVPSESGTYTLYMTPVNEDIIMESFQVLNNPPVQTVTSGYTAQVTGTQTQTWFFKIQATGNVTSPKIFDLRAQIFIAESLKVYAKQVDLLGKLSLNFFTPSTGPFGNVFPDSIVYWGQTDTYVAVTATPPNEKDQFIAAEKADLGLKPGFDMDYAFWSEQFDVDDLLVNENIILDSPIQPNSNYYFYTPTRAQLLGINSTFSSTAVFTNLDNPESVYNLASGANDILNSDASSQSLTLLPIGNYIVELTGTTNDEVRISTFDMIDIKIQEKANYFFSLNRPLFFKLPADLPIKEYFNVTYLDRVNMSIDMEFATYDSTGSWVSLPVPDRDFTFDAYSNNVDKNYQINNNTEVGTTTLNSQQNIFWGYLRVSMTGNTLWNTNQTTPTVNSTLLDIQASFSIERFNYFDVWSAQDPDREFIQTVFVNGDNRQLNVTKTEILYLYDFTSDGNPSGYKLSFISTNVSFIVYTFVDWETLWDTTASSSRTANGITTYFVDLEFGTTEQTNFGIYIDFNTGAANNGTYTTTLDIISVQSSPTIDIKSINSVTYVPPTTAEPTSTGPGDTVTATEDLTNESLLAALFKNPFTYAGIAGLGIGIAAIVYFIKSRRKTPF